MISSNLIDGVIILYLGFSFFMGFKKGLLNIIIDIFGIYGACILAWFFHETANIFLINNLNLGKDLNPTITFLLIWIGFYLLIYILGKLITGILNFTPINFILRISGATLNTFKACLILVLLLSTLIQLNDNLYKETKTTKRFVSIGSKLMRIYNRNIDEEIIELGSFKQPSIENSIIDENFKNNLLER